MAISSPVVLQPEFICPIHGVFRVRVRRPQEETPGHAPCPECGSGCPKAPPRMIVSDKLL